MAARPGTPSAKRIALRLYCVSRETSDSACAGSTVAKYSRFTAGPNIASEMSPRTPAVATSVQRVAGAHTMSAMQTGRPRCGSTSAPAPQSAAPTQRSSRAKYAARQMNASASGTISPKGSESTPSESENIAEAICHEIDATRASAATATIQAAKSSASITRPQRRTAALQM